MIDIWSTEHLSVYNNQETVFSLVPGKGEYTLGPGGDVDMVRPLRLGLSKGRAGGVSTTRRCRAVPALHRATGAAHLLFGDGRVDVGPYDGEPDDEKLWSNLYYGDHERVLAQYRRIAEAGATFCSAW